MNNNLKEVKKAIVNVAMLSGGGKLNTEQANTFLDMVIDQPTILKECRTVKMQSDNRKIEKIGFGQRVLTKATEGTAPGESTYKAPTTGMVNLSTKEFMAVVKITDDTLENNIEGESLEEHIVRLLAERVSLDLEELIIRGDKGSSDDYLAALDGIMKKTTSHVVDNAKAAVTKTLFKNAKKALPNKYLRDAKSWRYYVSYNAETEWQDQVATRATNLGDKSLTQNTAPAAYGIPVMGIAMAPNYDDSGTQLSDGLLVNPKNIVVGMNRDIRIETKREPLERSTYVVLTLKIDVVLEEEDAVVKMTKILE